MGEEKKDSLQSVMDAVAYIVSDYVKEDEDE